MVHGFSAGILSPAAQDQVDSQAWLAGAARLENFSVERDGGISGRPAFVRTAIEIPKPQYGLLANQAWANNSGAGVSSFVDGEPKGGGTHPSDLYDTPGGIAPLRIRLRATIANVNVDLLRFNLAAGNPRAITFHGIRIPSGSGNWAGQDAGLDRPNLRVVGQEIGAGSILDYTPSIAADEDADPLDTGILSPGSIPRDVVFRLDGKPETANRNLDWLALRFARAGAASAQNPFELAMDGVSVFSDSMIGRADNRPVATRLEAHVFDAPYRILPWTVRDVPFVLALGMDWVAALQVQDGGLVRRQGDDANSRAIWHFTERQLRELTSAVYGGNLLLCHHDFPHPLECRWPREGAPFQIRALRISNVPRLTEEQILRVAPNVSDETGDILTVAPSETRIAQIPQELRVELLTSTSLRVRWGSTGADTYRISWDTKAVYDAAVSGGRAWAPGNQRDVTAPATQTDLTGLVANTEYAVAISSVVGGNVSARSPVVFARTAFARPGAPSNVGIFSTPNVDARIFMTFNPGAHADRHELQIRRKVRGQAAFGAWSSSNTTANWFWLGVAGDTYQTRVRALRDNSVGPSAWVQSNELVLLNRTPGAVHFTQLDQGDAAGEVSLAWVAANPPADRYRIQYRPARPVGSEVAWQELTGLTGLMHTFSPGGTPGDNWDFRIRGERTYAAFGPWSAISKQTTQAYAAPTGLRWSQRFVRRDRDLVRAGTNINWNAVADATVYQIEVYPQHNLAGGVQNTLLRSTADLSLTGTNFGSFRIRAGFGTEQARQWGQWSESVNFN